MQLLDGDEACGAGQLLGAAHLDDITGGQHHPVRHRRGGGDQLQVVLALEPLPDDLLVELIDGPDDADPWGREALYDGDTRVGRLTSGGYSVVFGKSIGMGYVTPDLAVPGQKLSVKMQDRLWPAEIVQDSPYDPKNEVIRKDG